MDDTYIISLNRKIDKVTTIYNIDDIISIMKPAYSFKDSEERNR